MLRVCWLGFSYLGKMMFEIGFYWMILVCFLWKKPAGFGQLLPISAEL